MSQGGEISGVRTNSGAIVTAPPDSHTVTTAFGQLTSNVAKQNTLGYDIVLNISASATVAVAATIVLGVGPTNNPTMDPVTASFSAIGTTTSSFMAYIPSGYWIKTTNTGGVAVLSYVTQAMAV